MSIGKYALLLNQKIGFSFQPGKFQIFKSNLDFGQKLFNVFGLAMFTSWNWKLIQTNKTKQAYPKTVSAVAWEYMINTNDLSF